MATASATLQLAGACGELGVLPGRAVSGKTGGVEAGSARGVARGRPGVDAGVRRRHGEKQRERREERDGGDGSFVNKTKSKVLFVNSVFLLLPVLK